MHELGLCEDIVAAVERRAAGRRVTRVRVRIGALHAVVAPALEQAFELVAAGTVAEGAVIDLVVPPVRAACRACGHEARGAAQAPSCPACGATDLDVHGGDELLLESIQLAAGPVTAPVNGGEDHVPGHPG
jgi:hydrogenase nickel incorporation protein HypA/HybF